MPKNEVEKIISDFSRDKEISELLMRFAKGELLREDVEKASSSKIRLALDAIEEEQNMAG